MSFTSTDLVEKGKVSSKMQTPRLYISKRGGGVRTGRVDQTE